MKKLTVEVKQHADVMGKKQYYLFIRGEKLEMMMNIGEKSHNKIKEMLEKEPEEKAPKPPKP